MQRTTLSPATLSSATPPLRLPTPLEPFGLSSDSMVFIATDEPHGQVECVVSR